MRQVFLDRPFPYCDAANFRNEERYVLAFLFDQILDQHQTDKSFAEADTVAEEGTAITAGDFEQFMEAVFLVLIENLVDARFVIEPILIANLLPAEQFVQTASVDFK